MSIEQIYKQFMQEHDAETDTVEGELALAAAGENDKLFDLIADGLISKLRVGFYAGFKTAMQFMQEAAR